MSHYFENDNTLKSEEKLINVNYNNKTYSFYTDNGVFSKDTFDYGSRLLVENIKITSEESKVLDIGCGYGIIGILLKSTFPQINVDMCDINTRALNLAKKNSKLNNTEVNIFESNIYSNINKKYNYIITNPPIKTGKEITKQFLENASNYLEEDGELWFVMRKNHGVKSMIEYLNKIYNISIITKDKGYYIICGKNKK